MVDNKYYFYDLLLYNRVLHCGVIIELKSRELDYADMAQLNMYVNYYRDNMMQEGDNPPVGILLCTQAGQEMVKYCTPGIDENIFISTYMLHLPNFKVYEEFMFECGEKNAWTEATFEKMRAMLEDYKAFRPKLKFSDLTEKTLTQFVVYLRDEKQLRTPRKAKGGRTEYDEDDVTGLKNSTIKKKLGYMRWFLNWATDKGCNTNTAYKTFCAYA